MFGSPGRAVLSRPDFDAPSAPAVRAMSVTELNRAVRGTLERGYPSVRVRGEISNFVRAASGHLYFAVKDAGAQVRCAMWRNRAAGLAWQPRDGDAVELRASVTLFEARGDYQLNVESLTRAGMGALFEAFLALKDKLAREGLFDPSRKRAPSRLPRAIGIVTSLQAAALRDVLTTLARRAPMVPVVVYPAPVQGAEAAPALMAALADANRRGEVDTLILCRGGGSIEDLWAFNDEALARAIAASRIPVVSGVGHETDFTIADFAADLRAPTPTAAAELVAPPRAELFAELAFHARQLSDAIEARLAGARQRLDWVARELVPPSQRLAERRHRLDLSWSRLAAAMTGALARARQDLLPPGAALRPPRTALARARLEQSAARLVRAGAQALLKRRAELARLEPALAHLDPHAVLQRGYAVVRDAQGRAVVDAALLAAGDALDITLARGGVKARVE